MSTITINPGANIQRAINSAQSGDTIVFTSGAYNVSRVINLKSGVSLQGQPGATLQSNGTAGIFQGLGVHDINISGFTLDGKNGGPANSGAIYLDSSTGDGTGTPSNNIHIANNTFQNWTNNTGANVYLWHTQNTYVQGNTFKNGWEAVSWATDSSAPPLNNLVVSNNTITGMKDIGIETAFDSDVSNVHIDYNKISNIGDMSISFVEGSVGGGAISGTVWGNQIDASHSGGTPVELGNYNGPFNVTVSQNVISGNQWGMMFSHTDGMAVLNNTFTNVQYPFSDDGGYDRTEWIGTNSINGVSKTGWSGHTYGAEPTTYSPSAAPSSTTSALSAALTSTQQVSPALGASASSSTDATSATASPATGTAAASLAPIQQSTLLGSLGSTASFQQSTAGAAASSTQGSTGTGVLTQPAGGSLQADLTNVGSLDQALTGAATNGGSGTQTQPVNGIGAAFGNLDQSGTRHDALNADTWRHHA